VVEDEIVRLRKELGAEGLSAGKDAIRWHLERVGVGPVPSEATIWRTLKRRGLIESAPQRRPKSSYVRFVAAAPNERWQIDFTHWQLCSGRPVVIMNVIDDHSRVCVASLAAARPSSSLAWQAVCDAAHTWGLPASVLSDNGVEFTSHSATGGVFAENLAAVGVAQLHSRPRHPQTCGKVERLHQTTKKFLRAHRDARSITGLQTLLDTWRDRYNHGPHRGIGRRTPTEQWHASPPAHPGPPQLHHYQRVATLHTTNRGRIELTPWQIMLGVTWANQTVTAFVDDHDVAIFTTDGTLIRTLQINPHQRYQGLTNT
jgi:transposase InsO family protein